MNKITTIIIIVLLALIAFGVNFMGYEQLRANSGFFIPTPTQQDLKQPPIL